MISTRLLRASVAAMALLATVARPISADDTTTALKLMLAPGTSVRYRIQGELHQHQITTYNDDTTDDTSSDQTFEQVVRYDVAALSGDGAADATITVESFTLKKNDEAPVTATNVIQARGQLLPTGALRDVKVLSGTVPDLDRLGIGAFAFPYPTEPMTVGQAVDRPFPILLALTWHSDKISSHSQTKLTSLTPTAALASQVVDFHEADVPALPNVLASADVTGTASHTIERSAGWPASGKAEGKIETSINTAAVHADESPDTHAAVLTEGTLALVQTYERL